MRRAAATAARSEAAADHHADMAGGRRAGPRPRGRAAASARGRARRHDAVVARGHDEARQAADAAGSTGRPATRQSPAAGLLSPYQPAQAVARHRGGERHPVIEPVLQRDEQPRALAVPGSSPAKAEELRITGKRIERRRTAAGSRRPAARRAPRMAAVEQGRRRCRAAAPAPAARHGSPTGSRARPAPAISPAAAQSPAPARAARPCNSRAARPAAPAPLARWSSAASSRPGDVVGEREAALGRARRLPQSTRNGRSRRRRDSASSCAPAGGRGCRRG